MHSHNGKNNSSMLWMMIPCILLLGVVVIGGGKSSSGYLWPILIGVFVVAHIWMMFKGHRRHGDVNMQNEVDDISAKPLEVKNEDNNHKHSRSCH